MGTLDYVCWAYVAGWFAFLAWAVFAGEIRDAADELTAEFPVPISVAAAAAFLTLLFMALLWPILLVADAGEWLVDQVRGRG